MLLARSLTTNIWRKIHSWNVFTVYEFYNFVSRIAASNVEHLVAISC
jgi:hypothetical protein